MCHVQTRARATKETTLEKARAHAHTEMGFYNSIKSKDYWQHKQYRPHYTYGTLEYANTVAQLPHD